MRFDVTEIIYYLFCSKMEKQYSKYFYGNLAITVVCVNKNSVLYVAIEAHLVTWHCPTNHVISIVDGRHCVFCRAFVSLSSYWCNVTTRLVGKHTGRGTPCWCTAVCKLHEW